MPTNDRLDFTKWQGDVAGFQRAVWTMGQIAGWGNLRASGRRGAGSAEELIEFGHLPNWTKGLTEYAAHCADRTDQQWREFAASQKAEVSAK